jgi:hypothetical protein
MSTQELSGTTALVTGASRGFGRAIAIAPSSRGAHVVGVARDRARLGEVHAQLGDTFTPVAADATDPVVAGQLLDQHRPRTLVLNAGAAIKGSPLSGGYAGANATIRFIASYAAAESGQDALGIRFTAVLPQLTGATDLGAAAVAAYAARQGVDIPAFLEGRGPALTPERVGTAICDIAIGSGRDSGSGPGPGPGFGGDQDAFLLTAAGPSPAP